MQHPDEGTIHAWLDDALPAQQAAEIAAHVEGCRECADAVAEARGLIAASSGIVASLDHVRGGVLPSRKPASDGSLWRRIRFTPARAAIAASLLVGVGAMFAIQHRGNALVDSTQAVPAVSAPPAFASPALAPAPAPPPSSAVVADERLVAKKPATQSTKMRIAPDSSSRRVADASADTSAKAAAPAAVAPAAPAAPAVASHDMRAKVAQTTRQLQEVVTATIPASARARAFNGAAPPADAALEGCYRVNTDSATWLSAIPQSFALQRADGSGAPVVRAVTENGKIDSIVPGGEWHNVMPNMALVEFRGSRANGVTLRFTANPVRAEARSGDQAKSVGLERTRCQP